MPIRRTHYQTCCLCEAMCGLRMELEDDVIVDVKGDDKDALSRGYLCPKAFALKELQDDPDRLTRPLRRTKSGHQEISWDEALDEAAQRLHAIQKEHGRDTVAAYLGNPNVHNLGAMMFGPPFLRALRSKNRYSATSADQLPHMFVSYFMYGHQLLIPVPDIDRTDHFIIMGGNPLASNGSIMSAPGMRRRLREVRERGGKVTVIDPRRSETAKVADEHVFVRPGADAWLLLGMLRALLEGEGFDLAHLGPHVDGLAELRALVRQLDVDQCAEHSGVDAATIRRLAGELEAAPRAAVYGRMGLSTQAFGGLCIWLINVLNIVTGNLDREGGVMFATPAVETRSEVAGLGIGRGSFGRWRSRVRGLPEFGGELPVACLAEEMSTPGDGRVRALVTLAGNPVLSTPDGGALDEALAGLDFMVSVDFYLNETSRHADLILPPTPPLERPHYDLALNLLAVRNTARFSEACFEASPDARHDWQILHGLTTRLGALRGTKLDARLTTGALGKLGPERLLDVGLRFGPYGKSFKPFTDGLSLAELRSRPSGVDLGPLQAGAIPGQLPEGHHRIDLTPTAIVEDIDRLLASTRDSLDEGALLLIGRRHLRSCNSWLHNAESLVRGKDRCTLMMHPDDAKQRGITAGDRVDVRSRVGTVTAPVEITGDLMPGVVSLPHGFGHAREGVKLSVASAHAGVSINDLTDAQAIDELSGNAAFSGVPVSVAPA